MSYEKELDFVIQTDNILSDEDMEVAFQDFDFGKELLSSLEEHVAYQEDLPNGCRVTAIETPDSPVQSYEGKDIAKAREVLNLSPSRFASVLGVTPETVARWESGKAAPDGTACNLLYLLSSEPSLVNKFI